MNDPDIAYGHTPLGGVPPKIVVRFGDETVTYTRDLPAPGTALVIGALILLGAMLGAGFVCLV